MDHDNEITPVESTHEQVQLFLGSELLPLEKGTASSYDLVSEYEKTASHKDRRVWLWLVAVCAIVGLAAFTMTRIVSYQNKKIAISINTFDDLNLRGLLNVFGRTESMYQTAERQKRTLQTAMDFELEQALQKRESDFYTLESVATVTKPEEMQRRRGEIELSYVDAVNAIHEKYDEQIAEADAQMQRYQNQMDTFDSTQVASAQEQEAAIDSQKQLHDLEMKQQSERYERMIADLRAQLVSQQKRAVEEQRAAVENVRALYQARIDVLDPVVSNQHGDEVIRDVAERIPAPPETIAFNVQQYATGSSDSLSDGLAEVQDKFDEFDYISGIVASVPQENTIPAYVAAMRKLTHQIGDTMAGTAQSLQRKVSDFEAALEQYAAQDGADGVLLDASARPVFVVYVVQTKRSLFSEEKPVAVQIYDGKRAVAEATVVQQGDRYLATVADAKRAETVAALQTIHLGAAR